MSLRTLLRLFVAVSLFSAQAPLTKTKTTAASATAAPKNIVGCERDGSECEAFADLHLLCRSAPACGAAGRCSARFSLTLAYAADAEPRNADPPLPYTECVALLDKDCRASDACKKSGESVACRCSITWWWASSGTTASLRAVCTGSADIRSLQ